MRLCVVHLFGTERFGAEMLIRHAGIDERSGRGGRLAEQGGKIHGGFGGNARSRAQDGGQFLAVVATHVGGDIKGLRQKARCADRKRRSRHRRVHLLGRRKKYLHKYEKDIQKKTGA